MPSVDCPAPCPSSSGWRHSRGRGSGNGRGNLRSNSWLHGGPSLTLPSAHSDWWCLPPFLLSSDTILAFRLFVTDLMPDWTSPLVMVTCTLGQGLIIAGLLITLRSRGIPTGHTAKVVP